MAWRGRIRRPRLPARRICRRKVEVGITPSGKPITRTFWQIIPELPRERRRLQKELERLDEAFGKLLVLEEEDPEEVRLLLQAIVARVEITDDRGRVFFTLPLHGYDGYPWVARMIDPQRP